MFIPAHELMGFGPLDDPSESEYSEAYGLLAEKRRENTQTKFQRGNVEEKPLIKSVAKEGVKTPVNIVEHGRNGSTIWNGHHRIVAAYDVNPNMEVPVDNQY
jgi:hypothetical protein